MISDINIQVNRDFCYACGICVDRCIMDNLRLSVAPCRQACPLYMNCQGYVRLIAQGRPEDAAREMAAATPFGAILGRICTHPCEPVCERGKIDGAVHIRALKRYLADAFDEKTRPGILETAPDTDRRVAVVGSGPAGLNAAYDLRREGHRVTVYEADADPGGLLRYAVPSFRLPIGEVDQAIKTLANMGISFETCQALGRNLDLENLQHSFDAVVLALGAGPGQRLDIPGRDLTGVIPGLELLRRIKAGEKMNPGNSVVVIGGGNTAVDAAISCRRLGAGEVTMVCLEDRDCMPAFDLEVTEALEEGIQLIDGWGLLGMERIPDGRIRVNLSRCISLVDAEGRFCPLLEGECGRFLEATTVVTAVGQRLDAGILPTDLIDSGSGRLAADPLTLQSRSREKIFVCGDAHSGPSSVVEAMASGREAAFSVIRYLRGEGLRWDRGFWNGARIQAYEVDPARARGGPRGCLARISPAERRLETETEFPLNEQEARREAERCLSCGRAAEINRTCWFCLPCEIECPVDALQVRIPYLVR